jgi:hypothetical protein
MRPAHDQRDDVINVLSKPTTVDAVMVGAQVASASPLPVCIIATLGTGTTVLVEDGSTLALVVGTLAMAEGAVAAARRGAEGADSVGHQ